MVTTMISSAACERETACEPIPEGASIRMRSVSASTLASERRRHSVRYSSRFASSSTPLLAGTTRIPSGPSSTMSSMRRSPRIASWRSYWGEMPSRRSTFASPRSPSSTSTRVPCLASAIARFVTMFVLPTPPFPLVTAITLRRGRDSGGASV